jgi:methylated-DNA-[protein]-cysteine S-methyltransferase
MSQTTLFTQMPSPIGLLTLTSDGHALTSVLFEDDDSARRPPDGWARDDGALREPRRQLEEYFAGKRAAFDLPLAMHGTPFQMRVWSALRGIPFGATASYGEIARRIGSPGASRAVGGANHRNPIAIIVPCHRVIGANGSLTGYGGGEARKRKLLALESG